MIFKKKSGEEKRKYNSNYKFLPYHDNYEDLDEIEFNGLNIFSNNLFTKIEEVFAIENYRKADIPKYNYFNNNLCSFMEGFHVSALKNDYNINSNIVEVINTKFDTNLTMDEFIEKRITNEIEIYADIYNMDVDKTYNLDKESKDKIEKYIKEISNVFGKVLKWYQVDEKMDDNIKTVNKFYIIFSTYFIVYEKGIVIIGWGSDA